VMYQQHCAACHGRNGKGDGPAASAMTTKPTDITVMQRRHGAFFTAQLESAIRGTDPVVAHGVPGMMVWGALFRADAHGNEAVVDARIEDLVAFVETIQQK
jgi:mono/diheme cytochrome c family protein